METKIAEAQPKRFKESPGAIRIKSFQWANPPRLFEFSKKEPVGLGRPAGKSTVIVDRKAEKEIHSLQWAEMTPLSIDCGRLFEAVANQDFWSREPRISDDLYFIDPEKHVILHMYDDRGMDVIAADLAALRRIYSTLNGWILDYNRKQIDDIFQSTSGQ